MNLFSAFITLLSLASTANGQWRQENIGDYEWTSDGSKSYGRCEDSRGKEFSYGSLIVRFRSDDPDLECAKACVDAAPRDSELKAQCINLTGVETNASERTCNCLFERSKDMTIGGPPWTGTGGGEGTGSVARAYYSPGWTCHPLTRMVSSCSQTSEPVPSPARPTAPSCVDLTCGHLTESVSSMESCNRSCKWCHGKSGNYPSDYGIIRGQGSSSASCTCGRNNRVLCEDIWSPPPIPPPARPVPPPARPVPPPARPTVPSCRQLRCFGSTNVRNSNDCADACESCTGRGGPLSEFSRNRARGRTSRSCVCGRRKFLLCEDRNDMFSEDFDEEENYDQDKGYVGGLRASTA